MTSFQYINTFHDKVLLITGGTGSFGTAVLDRLINSGLREIRIFSRDEKKQEDLRKRYSSSLLSFYIGDVRDFHSVLNVCRGVDYVFHAAALKQVPSCEFHPLEAAKTNVLGTENVLEASIRSCVERVVVLSTDKAVYPINAMGISKALMEKVAVAKSRNSNKTIINITRYGNVMCSRGSVIPLFANQIIANRAITITDPAMTRFMMTLDEAVDLVLYAFINGKSGEIFVQKSPATTIKLLAKSISNLLGKPDHDIQVIGTRHGEKLYEVLLSREEMVLANDLGQYFCVPPDLRDLNYDKYIDSGEVSISHATDYNSHNTQQLDCDGIEELLLKTRFIRKLLNKIV